MKTRLDNLSDKITGAGLSGFVTFHPGHLRYLTGFTGSSGCVWMSDGNATLITDGRYTEQARQEVTHAHVIITKPGQTLHDALTALIPDAAVIGFESRLVSVWTLRKLQETLPTVEWRPTDRLVESLRDSKDPSEIAAIRRAIEVSEQSYLAVQESIGGGVTERKLASRLDYEMRLRGAERSAFDTIVAFGDHAALPHARPGDRVLQANECVLIDFGAVVDGYHADLTRTVYYGVPPAEFLVAYEAVQEAHLAAAESIRVDGPCRQADAVARTALEKRGLAEFFTHSLGHGIGLDIHESPTLGMASDERFSENQILTIEPGLYIPGRFGIRIENDYRVTREGVENLVALHVDLVRIDA